jgi:hypothetical protein
MLTLRSVSFLNAVHLLPELRLSAYEKGYYIVHSHPASIIASHNLQHYGVYLHICPSSSPSSRSIPVVSLHLLHIPRSTPNASCALPRIDRISVRWRRVSVRCRCAESRRCACAHRSVSSFSASTRTDQVGTRSCQSRTEQFHLSSPFPSILFPRASGGFEPSQTKTPEPNHATQTRNSQRT